MLMSWMDTEIIVYRRSSTLGQYNRPSEQTAEVGRGRGSVQQQGQSNRHQFPDMPQVKLDITDTLYCELGLSIKEGDMVVANFPDGRQARYKIVGRPQRFKRHQAVNLEITVEV